MTSLPIPHLPFSPRQVKPQLTCTTASSRSIVIAVVSWLDLNTLDALARTSRRVHHSLVQYRATLLRATLRCAHEGQPVDRGETLRFRARAGNWYYMEDGRSYSGKAGDCARDMVGQCRRCGDVVCRVSGAVELLAFAFASLVFVWFCL